MVKAAKIRDVVGTRRWGLCIVRLPRIPIAIVVVSDEFLHEDAK